MKVYIKIKYSTNHHTLILCGPITDASLMLEKTAQSLLQTTTGFCGVRYSKINELASNLYRNYEKVPAF